MIRCASCGASNLATASWCSQCHEPVTATGPLATTPDDPTPTDPATLDPAVAPATSGTAGHVLREGFRVREGEAEWACPRCSTYTSVASSSCRACGTPMQERFAEPAPPRREVSLLTVFALSALLPGAGHLALGRYGTGTARAILFVVWLAGGVLLSSGGGGAAVAAPLVVGAVAVWIAGLADVVALSVGSRQVLEGRALLWLVVAVTGLALVGAVAAAGTSLPLS